ncbi:uncharacterized protein K452DRAFT_113222 [Aplosporella prunicola CBS 121167]|uniref:Uncharacterized protein n=1 Tax=Aplosporella prunicola CBS 121167 TaxID=1176127 RepID=A0A6A6B147_9PEZI|nr:uncharacterized protein K452DRAFT_113222 [Aplosporella prunicola CBS 121167]KAF2137153.1 hypothetical protein K452DRAFT_113222 [Aplosporella prunicola CBS 121167]
MTAHDTAQQQPHAAPHSLAAAAALNAGIQHEANPVHRERRRSSLRVNLNRMDPTIPSPGEVQRSPSLHSHRPSWSASPQHQRNPSLPLAQELEEEQEAQVNRLLGQIRAQQAQIATLQSQHPSGSAIDDSTTPTSERSLSLSTSAAASQTNVNLSIAPPRSLSPRPIPGQAPASLSRNSSYRQSRTSSRNGSPALRPVSSQRSESGDWSLGGGVNRDESAFYQAETQMLTRENQMLKMRIRELERQLHGLNPTSPITQAPALSSNLSSPPIRPAEEAANPAAEAGGSVTAATSASS